MAFPLPRGITPPEIAFLAEMELVTIVPRQRLEGLDLLGVSAVLLSPSNTIECACMAAMSLDLRLFYSIYGCLLIN